MPNVDELISRLGYMVDTPIGAKQAVDLFNQCLEDLSVYARYEKKQSGTVALNQTIPYPDDCIKIFKIELERDGGKEEVKSKGTNITYEKFGGEIGFSSSKEDVVPYTIFYYASIPSIPFKDDQGNDISDYGFKPSLQERFHNMLPLYAAIRYLENWGGSENLRDNYRAQYEGLKTEYTREQFRSEYRNRPRKIERSGWMD